MASQAKITMDLSSGDCDDYLQIGGQMMTLPLTEWGLDEGGLPFECVNTTASGDLDDVLCSVAPVLPAPGAKCDNLSSEKFSVFGDVTFIDAGGYDLESLLSGQAVQSEAVQAPAQPTQEMSWLADSSVDSTLISLDALKGLSEPGSPDCGFGSLSDAPSPTWVLADSSVDSTLISQDALKGLSEPGSPDSGVGSLSDAPSPTRVSSPEVPALLSAEAPPMDLESLSPGQTTITVCQEDLELLKSLWGSDLSPLEPFDGVEGSPEVLKTAVAPASPAKLPPKPISPGPKRQKVSKCALSLSSEEKRERKRAQNKNAATRYREKKREEARVIFEEQTKLEEKNKTLTDKVTLITREIQYMKELLTEVYRAKGLVE